MDQAGTLKYQLAHMFAFNMVLLNLGVWKFKYLFHDCDKLITRILFFGNMEKVQRYHKSHCKHHTECYLRTGKMDPVAMAVDWESFTLTKDFGKLNAEQTLERTCKKLKEKGVPQEKIDHLYNEVTKVLIQTGLKNG